MLCPFYLHRHRYLQPPKPTLFLGCQKIAYFFKTRFFLRTGIRLWEIMGKLREIMGKLRVNHR